MSSKPAVSSSSATQYSTGPSTEQASVHKPIRGCGASQFPIYNIDEIILIYYYRFPNAMQ